MSSHTDRFNSTDTMATERRYSQTQTHPVSRSFSIAAGSLCLTISTLGLLSSMGLFQTYWHNHQLAALPKSNIAWIPAVFGFLDAALSMPAGILYDSYGASVLLPISSILYLASFIGLAFASTYTHLMSCFVVAGLSAAGQTTVAFTVVSQWFHLRRGLAVGFVSTGAAVGGLIFPLILRILFNELSWKNAIIVLSAILFCLLGLGNLLIKAPNVEMNDAKMDLSCFRSSKFWLLCYAVFAVYELVLFILWGSIPALSISTGLGDQYYLVVTYNIGSLIGRSIPPWLADLWFGPLNTTIMMNGLTCLIVLAMWLPYGDSSVAALFSIVGLLGIGTGSFVPLSSACIFAHCEPERSGTWFGSIYAVTSLAVLIGNPIMMAILERYGIKAPAIFIGCFLCSALATVLALRWVCLDRRWAWLYRI
ncbi:major facilitator superfamily domain-containing protein [Coniochaeta sp. 2T2.1]|nr:major facilitator superfamily domain-containing protein [Coniochaeta sp. 2T2.1]